MKPPLVLALLGLVAMAGRSVGPPDAPADVLDCSSSSLAGGDLLATRVNNARFVRVRMERAIWQLREEHHVPISFIDAPDDDRTVDYDGSGNALRELLVGLTRQAPRFRYEIVQGRLVVYPNDPEYDLRVRVAGIAKMARYAAAAEYVQQLKKQQTRFKNWYGPIAFGTNPDHWIFKETVSVRPVGRVIEQLGDLAGPGSELSFHVAGSGAFKGVNIVNFVEVAGFRQLLVTMNPQRVHVGETTQLTLIGEGWDGRRVRLTPASCGTRYSSLVPGVIEVEPGGLVVGVSAGRTLLNISNRGTSVSVVIEVLARPGHGEAADGGRVPDRTAR